MSRKNFYKVIFTTADELFFFLFFTHAQPLSPTPQRTYVKRLCPSSRVTAFYRAGGREGELQNIFEDVALFYEGTQKLQLFMYLFIKPCWVRI